MDALDRGRLLGNRVALATDLDVNHVLHYLIQEGVLDNRDDQEVILNEITSTKRAAKLIDILLTRGPQAYRIFKQSLLKTYPHLVEKLDTWDQMGRVVDNTDRSASLDSLQQALREQYLTALSHTSPIPWCDWYLLDFSKIYTSLQLVRGDKRSAFHAAVHQDTGCNYLRDIHAIFDPHQECPNPRRILIEGDPGIGKSTLCCKLAFDWASQKRPNENTSSRTFDLVIFLRATDLCDGTLYEKICDSLLPEDFHLSKDEVKQCIERRQERTLLIVDGYDEVKTPPPEVTKLLQGKLLRHATVLVTSRPKYALPLLKHFDTLLLNRGYDENRKEELLQKCATEMGIPAQTVTALKKELLTDVALSEMTRNPLNLSVLCLLAAEHQDSPLPQTRTALYSHLHNFLLEKASHRLEVELEDLQCQCNALQAAAFKALLAKRNHLLRSDFHSDCRMTTVLQLGFLSQEVKISQLRATTTYAFTHRSFQEFLSAKHLASLSRTEREEALSKFMDSGPSEYTLLFLCGMLEEVADLRDTLRLIIGHCHMFHLEQKFLDLGVLDVMDNHKCHMAFQIFEEVAIDLGQVWDVLKEFEIQQVAFSAPWCAGHCLKGFAKFCRACNGDPSAGFSISLVISCHALEESYPAYCQMMESLKGCRLIHSIGFHSIGSLAQLQRAIKLASCCKRIMFKFLGPVGECRDSLDSLSMQTLTDDLVSMDLIECSSSSVVSILLGLVPSGPSFRELSIQRCGLSDAGCQVLASKLTSWGKLQTFRIEENTIHCSRSEAILGVFKSLQELNSLVEFCVSRLSSRVSQELFPRPDDVTPTVRPFLKEILKNNPLQSFHIATCELGGTFFEILAELVKKRSLQMVGICDCFVSYPPGFHSFLDAVPNSSVSELDLRGSTLKLCGYPHLGHLFSGNTSLKKFSLSPVDSDAVCSMSQGLANNHTLRDLTLLSISFRDTTDSLQVFAESIQTCTALQNLTMSTSGASMIHDSDFSMLIRSLGSCPSLRRLSMRKFGIGSHNIGVLAEVLSGSPQIVDLNLQHNGLKPGAANVLCKALSARPPMDVLNVLDNPLTQSDPEVVQLKERVRHLKVGWF